MYHVSTQGIDERRINVHYYYYTLILTLLSPSADESFQLPEGILRKGKTMREDWKGIKEPGMLK